MASGNSLAYEDAILRRDFRRWRACAAPEAWAQYRHPAAKALPWFTMVQGGVCVTPLDPKSPRHSPTQYITGLLMDGYPAENSYLDAEVVITSIHSPKKELTNQAKRRVQALDATRRDKRLVGCLVGKNATKTDNASTPGRKRKWSHAGGQAFFSCPMPENQDCWVLSFYTITDIWDAVTNEGSVTMTRLERWKLQDKAWFASTDPSHNPPPLAARDFTTRATAETCGTCGQTSPRMFEEYFLCRNKNCADFWKHNGEVSTGELTYTKLYLQQRDPRPAGGFKPYGAYNGDSEFPELAAPFHNWWARRYQAFQNVPITKDNFQSRMRDLNTGFWCPSCGMLNRRLKWNEWNCANGMCNFRIPGQPTIMTAAQITDIGKTVPPDWTKLPGFAGQEDTPDYMRYNYDLRHGCGVAVLVPKESTNAKSRGSDWLFDRLQVLANAGTVPLEKQFSPSFSPGTVTSHFIANFGETYRLAVNIPRTTAFRDAPAELTHVRDVANTLCRRYQTRPGAEDFNQLYIAGYFADNMMHWHNDGENGLGSAIATWTLGGEGEMTIAPNIDQYWGRNKKDFIYEGDLLLRGVRHEAERRALKEELEQKLLAYTDENNQSHKRERQAARDKYRDAFKKLFDKDPRPAKPQPHVWLKIPMTHGSIVVMHGDNMQRYYLHQAVVKTPMRFALTLRHISQLHLSTARGPSRRGLYPHFPDKTYLTKFLASEQDGKGEKPTKKRQKKAKDDGDGEDEADEE